MDETPETDQPAPDREEGPRDQPDGADELHDVPQERNPQEEREAD